ncbi:hypothetical protein [Aquamicrobium terrae]|uniref:Uncharacterized protein n=1 Tax=Aquamicrobium terrae TaxID=1324945 RepID=A0ABV2MV76_9HYPH
MADLPILFSAPMVRAILREIEQPGTGKTQTRRVLDAWCDEPPAVVDEGVITAFDENDKPYRWPRTAAVGDRLYVREAWHAARSLDRTPPRDIPRDADIEHAATARSYAEIGLKGKLRPAMFLPRWASRITLIVTDVRVQRLQEISRDDAISEGLIHKPGVIEPDWWVLPEPFHQGSWLSPVAAFRFLWESLNAARGYVWDTNPWVAAYTFTPILGNIDQIGGA